MKCFLALVLIDFWSDFGAKRLPKWAPKSTKRRSRTGPGTAPPKNWILAPILFILQGPEPQIHVAGVVFAQCSHFLKKITFGTPKTPKKLHFGHQNASKSGPKRDAKTYRVFDGFCHNFGPPKAPKIIPKWPPEPPRRPPEGHMGPSSSPRAPQDPIFDYVGIILDLFLITCCIILVCNVFVFFWDAVWYLFLCLLGIMLGIILIIMLGIMLEIMLGAMQGNAGNDAGNNVEDCCWE